MAQPELLIDITVSTGTGMPIWGSPDGLRRNWRARAAAIDLGDEARGFHGQHRPGELGQLVAG
jgi:hypothetical protein